MAEAAEGVWRPSLEVIRGWAGHRLDELGGGAVGRVEGAFVAERSGAPEWLLARMGRFGHYTLIPSRYAVEGVGHVWVPYTRDQIRKGPRVEPDAALTVATETELLDHYGLAARDDGDRGAIAARPVS
jgi:hypothetical protein